ncbi:hypothetical protein [Mycobacterium stomatepiae]|uniref:Uncharacterized protein n=1 Tax=Mycobacterium stomatepiae TaxID=470076 RepID=A0A7I7Q1G3_9MYCO|nr:hypothetical protein [Mycobacterium stomatepiae]MCV7166390.1 hypothetical protein [Mycobacterium stomatepiae]BBY20059.1 hypothetical protein MSTO_02640 [Mycobacterium stomatepiae]
MRSVIDLAGSEVALDAALLGISKLSFEGLTTAELWELLERYDFMMGKLAARKYELTSPFSRHRNT